MDDEMDPYKWQKVERLEFLIDGIFAIVMTLLVLDIRLPVSEAVHSEADLMKLLAALLPKIASYTLSFMVLASYWSAYGAQFHYIHKCDRRLYFYAVLLLLSVSFMPFTTAFLSEHLEFKTSIALYWLNLTCIGFSLALHWRHAYKRKLLKIEDAQANLINKLFMQRGARGMVMTTIVALLAFISPYLTIVCYLLFLFALMFGFDQPLGNKKVS